MKAILLDIEGTTTPIDFVHEVLFPYARDQMRDFVRDHNSEIQPEIAQLHDEHAQDCSKGKYHEIFDKNHVDSVSAYLQFLISVDRKSTPLKTLQGKIWQYGYESGDLVSQVFDDVPPAFQRWKAENKMIAIYSSGSVLAQQLIFKYSDHGDLTPWVEQYFDTKVGHKREVSSYQNISSELEQRPEEILFISDIVEELDAARDAGLNTALAVRKGNAEIDGKTNHTAIDSFDDVSA